MKKNEIQKFNKQSLNLIRDGIYVTLTPIFLMRGLKMRSFLASSSCRLRSMDAAILRSSGVARC